MKAIVWIFFLLTTISLSSIVHAQAPKTNTLIKQPEATHTSSSDDFSNQLDEWLKDNLDEGSYKALQMLPKKISEIAKMLDTQLKTESEIADLEKQMRADESMVQEKRRALSEIQRKIDLLRLTTNQIATIEKYNKSLDRDPHFTEWLTERGTWFEIGKDIMLSGIFLFLGVLVESARQKRKKRKKKIPTEFAS